MMKTQSTQTKRPLVWWDSNVQCRSLNGWFQWRYNGESFWQYQVSVFSGPAEGEGTAHVFRVSPERTLYTEPCRIDARNRILIDGKWIGRRRWDH